MGHKIKFSVHRNPQKDAEGNSTYHVRHEARGTLSLRYLQDHLQYHQRMLPEQLQSAFIVFEEELLHQLTDNYRLHIEGLGIFFLKLGFRERKDENGASYIPKFTDPEQITGDDICVETIGFTPDKELLQKFRNHGYYFNNVSEQGTVGHSNIYTEEEIRTLLNQYLDNHQFVSRKGFMGHFRLTGYMADKWLDILTTGPSPMLRRTKIGNAAVFYRIKQT